MADTVGLEPTHRFLDEGLAILCGYHFAKYRLFWCQEKDLHLPRIPFQGTALLPELSRRLFWL